MPSRRFHKSCQLTNDDRLFADTAKNVGLVQVSCLVFSIHFQLNLPRFLDQYSTLDSELDSRRYSRLVCFSF